MHMYVYHLQTAENKDKEKNSETAREKTYS